MSATPPGTGAQGKGELAEALAQHGADYLFLGKAGAILLGYPGTTLDLDLFAPKDAENGRHCIAALRDLTRTNPRGR